MAQNDKFVSASVGGKLREIRKRKGVRSAESLSRLMDSKYSPSGILRREEGNLKLDFTYLQIFCNALTLNQKEKDDVLAIARLDLWRSRRSMLDLTRELHEMMLRAQNHISYVATGIPGELQTYSYTRSLVETYAAYGDIEERTQIRFRTERSLLQDPLKELRILCSEHSLYLGTGSREIMLEQLESLKRFSSTSSKEFRILPANLFLRIPNRESFFIFDSQFAFCQTRIGMITAEDAETVLDLKKDFDLLWSHSVEGAKLVEIVDKAIRFYQL